MPQAAKATFATVRRVLGSPNVTRDAVLAPLGIVPRAIVVLLPAQRRVGRQAAVHGNEVGIGRRRGGEETRVAIVT